MLIGVSCRCVFGEGMLRDDLIRKVTKLEYKDKRNFLMQTFVFVTHFSQLDMRLKAVRS